ncbi:hypothetical protein ES703_82786 [subsurface metagenome]
MVTAIEAPLMPNRGISRRLKTTVRIKEINEAKLTYWGNPRPVKSLLKTLLMLKKKIPGRSNFKAMTEGRNRDVNNQGITKPEILYKIKTAKSVKRAVFRQTTGVNLLAASVSEAAVLGYNTCPIDFEIYHTVSPIRTATEYKPTCEGANKTAINKKAIR